MLPDRSATLALIRQRLAPLGESTIEIFDDSHLHAGHAGAREGGHFRLQISAPAFGGLSTLQRHRKVLALLGDLAAAGIHALSISASDGPPAA
jgi:BolA family transcriptional regulator, general stress-responsive regulator